MFNLAGVPVNNSRVLAFRANLNPYSFEPCGIPAPNNVSLHNGSIATNVTQRNFTVYLKYVKLARIFLNNIEIEQ
jgi:hypothetical protein